MLGRRKRWVVNEDGGREIISLRVWKLQVTGKEMEVLCKGWTWRGKEKEYSWKGCPKLLEKDGERSMKNKRLEVLGYREGGESARLEVTKRRDKEWKKPNGILEVVGRKRWRRIWEQEIDVSKMET
jgi:hypothetical protein